LFYALAHAGGGEKMRRMASSLISQMLSGAGAAAIVVFAAGCVSRETPDAQKMAPYDTFTVVSATSLEGGTSDAQPAIVSAIEGAIADSLVAKGYTPTPAAKADYTVRYTVTAAQSRPLATGAAEPSISNANENSATSGALDDSDVLSLTFVDASGRILWKPSTGLRGSARTLSVSQFATVVRETIRPLPMKVKATQNP
jgi:hypothetical protein